MQTARRSTGCIRMELPQLPHDILLILFSFMHYCTFWHGRLVNKTWKESWDVYWEQLTAQDFMKKLPLWLFECKLQVPNCGLLRLVHPVRNVRETHWTVKRWIEEVKVRLRMLDEWNGRIMSRMKIMHLKAKDLQLQGLVLLRMVSSMRTSEIVPWFKFLEEYRMYDKKLFAKYRIVAGAIEKHRIDVLEEEQAPWFYNDAMPPSSLLARAKSFPSSNF